VKIAVLGLGYVGAVTAAVLASSGHEVSGVDIDEGKVDLLASGRSPVIEPDLGDLICSSVARGTLKATTDIADALIEAELSLICVGTPSLPQGGTDLSAVVRAVTDIVSVLQSRDGPDLRFHAVVIRSTVPPGTLERVIGPLLRVLPPSSVGAGVCPEFLREGCAVADFHDTPFAVVGTHDPRVGDAVRRLFSFIDAPVQVIKPSSAEALKYACNAFHATKISFSNELARLFRELGVDSREVLELFCQDTKLNISTRYLAPGFAFGGSCLPKDLRSLLYLGRVNCLDMPMLSGTLTTNALSVGDVVNRVIFSDARHIALLGLSFKMGSDDLRESPYVELAEILIGKGFNVRIYDPAVEPATLVGSNRQYIEAKLPHLHRVLTSSAAEALEGIDIALVSNSAPDVMAALLADPPRRIIDLSGRLGTEVEALAGYEGVAW
jgi:GDP-mannose 6-dehydrogenase